MVQNLHTREFILVRNPMNVKDVERPLFVAHTLVNIKKFIWDRGEDMCNASNFDIWKFVLEKHKQKAYNCQEYMKAFKDNNFIR